MVAIQLIDQVVDDLSVRFGSEQQLVAKLLMLNPTSILNQSSKEIFEKLKEPLSKHFIKFIYDSNFEDELKVPKYWLVDFVEVKFVL